MIAGFFIGADPQIVRLFTNKRSVFRPIPIYMRITVEGKRAEVSIKRECDPSEWNTGASRVKGTKEKARALNAYIDDWLASVYDAEKELILANIPITANSLKKKLLGEVENPFFLIEIFKQHNRKVKALVGNEFAAGTLTRDETSLKHTQNFIRWYYKVDDLDIKKTICMQLFRNDVLSLFFTHK
jgi:hypothetical protein